MNRDDFQKLADIRMEDAQILFSNGRNEGCYYLCGFAVECGLKACIAKMMKLSAQYDFPDKGLLTNAYHHDPTNLLKLAGLEGVRFEEAGRDRQFRLNWLVVKEWKAADRYDLSSGKRAEELFNAVADRRHGVLRCIKQYW